MRRFLFAALVLALALSWHAHATTIALTGAGTGSPVVATPPSVSFRTSASNASCATCNLGTLDIGTADATRLVCLTIGITGANSAQAITSATIAGVTATTVKELVGAARASAVITCAPVPTGATGNVTVTYASNQTIDVGIYALYNLNSSTATATSSAATTTSGQTITLDLNVQAAGIVLGSACDNADNAFSSFTWVGATAGASGDYTLNNGSGDWTGASFTASGAETPHTFSQTIVTSGRGAGVAAAFR